MQLTFLAVPTQHRNLVTTTGEKQAAFLRRIIEVQQNLQYSFSIFWISLR
jgi:hypothetical protein